MESIIEVRRTIGCQGIYQEDFVFLKCQQIYGRNIGDGQRKRNRTWQRWKKKVLAHADPPSLGGMSTATYVLLITLARQLAGNSQSRSQRKLSQQQLAQIAINVLNDGLIAFELPELIDYEALLELIEAQAGRTYTDRYHRQNGLKKNQPWYPRTEAVSILKNYPNLNDVQQAS